MADSACSLAYRVPLHTEPLCIQSMDILGPARNACQALAGSSLPRNRPVICPQYGLVRPGADDGRAAAGPAAIAAIGALLNIHSMLGIVLGGVTSERDGSRRGWLSTQDERSFDERYRHWAGRSGELFAEASRYIPGGAGSSARTVKFGWKPYPPFMAEGTGSRLRDVDGHEYVDYLLGLGPMILGPPAPGGHPGRDPGHDRPRHLLRPALRAGDRGRPQGHRGRARRRPGAVLQLRQRGGRHGRPAGPRAHRPAAGRSASRGTTTAGRTPSTGATTSTRSWPARPRMPRPVPSGPGVPAELADTLIVLTWNDPESFIEVMDERGDEVAAVITEPAVFNTGCILPEPGYLELLREQTRRHGALLIFDEVITGFRFARGGAQEFFGVTPDLTTHGQGPRRRLPRRRDRRVARGHVHDRRGPVLALRHLQRQRRSRARRSARPWTCWPSPACSSGSARSASR